MHGGEGSLHTWSSAERERTEERTEERSPGEEAKGNLTVEEKERITEITWRYRWDPLFHMTQDNATWLIWHVYDYSSNIVFMKQCVLFLSIWSTFKK